MRHLFLLLVFLSPSVFGQFVQDASGKSTIKLNGSVLNVDVTDTRLNYWYQQTSTDQGRIANKLRLAQLEIDSLQKLSRPTLAQQGAIILSQEKIDALQSRAQKKNDKSMRGNLIGFRIFAENGSGITNLFNSGLLVPKSGLDFTIGRFYSVEFESGNIYRKRLGELGKRKLRIDSSQQVLETRGLRDPNYFEKLNKLDSEEAQIKREININRYKLSKVNKTSFQVTPYLNFESNVSSVLTTPSVDFVKNVSEFKKTIPISFIGTVGTQTTIGRSMIAGLSFGYSRADNLNDLSEKEFKQTNTIAGSQITYSDTKKAYVGDYRENFSRIVNGDLLWRLNGTIKNDSLIFFLNPYVRYKEPYGTRVYPLAETTVSTTNIGISLYIFKSKGVFVGGFYTELQDVNNNKYDRAKSIAERTTPQMEALPFVKITDRLQIGIFGKISFRRLGAFNNGFIQ